MNKIGNIVYPEEFNNRILLAHVNQQEELKKILESSGLKKAFLKQYRQRLKFLITHLDTFHIKPTWFENLKNAPDIYSMRFNKLEKNIRILFCIKKIDKQRSVILLTAFEERKGSDYNKAINTAIERLKELVDKEEIE